MRQIGWPGWRASSCLDASVIYRQFGNVNRKIGSAVQKSLYTGFMIRDDDDLAAAEFYDRRRQWAEYVSSHPNLSDRGFRVGFWLSRRMNGDDRCCWYSVPRIAKEMGKSVRYVRYALCDLQNANVMVVVPEKGKTNRYFLNAPFF